MSQRSYRDGRRGGGRQGQAGPSNSYYNDIEATRNASAIITVHNNQNATDNDSVSVLSDPSAAWATAAHTHSMLGLAGGLPPSGANGGADDEYDYYCQEQGAVRQAQELKEQQEDLRFQKQAQCSWLGNQAVEQQHRQVILSTSTPPSQSAHGIVRSYSSTPSTGDVTEATGMDEEAVEMALQRAFQNQDYDRRKTAAVISTDDPDFWSIADGGKGSQKRIALHQQSFCRRNIRLIVLLLCLVLVCGGVAAVILLLEPWLQNGEQTNASSLENSFGGVTGSDVTSAPTGVPTDVPTSIETLAPSLAPSASPTATETKAPTAAPTKSPTEAPTAAATRSPTQAPTAFPTTAAPTNIPTTSMPTPSPSSSTAQPTMSPSLQRAQNPDPEDFPVIIADNEEGTGNGV